MLDELINLKSRKQINIFNLAGSRNSDSLIRFCEDLLQGTLYMSEQSQRLKAEMDTLWASDPFNDRSWRFWVHCLNMNEHLINGYERFRKEAYLEGALKYLWSWKKYNYPNSDSDMAWHDHSTALRLIIICRVFEAWRLKFWNDDTAVEFWELVKAHCDRLADQSFYRIRHNHGLDQDIALYVAGTVFYGLEEAAGWREMSMNRLQKQLEYLYAPDGSYLEHSPTYTYLVCDRLIKFMNFLKEQESLEYLRLEKLINDQLIFLTSILQPNGETPPLGDSYPTPVALKIFENFSGQGVQYLKYASSGGKEGIPPGKLDNVFPDGGYAIMRNKWEYHPDTIQLIFYSSFHSRVHKHHDDLALTLFGFNQPLLADASKYNYNYKSPERQYVESSMAHNSVVVDESDTEITRHNIGRSGLTGYYSDGDVCLASGAHGLYKGVVHERLVVYLKPWDILVIDRLSSSSDHKYEQVFNFHPAVDCKLHQKAFKAVAQNGMNFYLSPLLSVDELNTQIVKGQENPLRGWCSLEYGKLTSAWSGAYGLYGKDVRFATHINLLPGAQRLKSFDWNDNMIEIEWKQIKINMTFDKADDENHISYRPFHAHYTERNAFFRRTIVLNISH